MATREARVDTAVEETSRLRQQVDQLEAHRSAEMARLHEQIIEGRQIAHAVNGELQAVTGMLEMMLAEGALPTPHLQEIEDAITRLGRIASLFSRLHAMVRGLDPLP